MKRKPSRQVTLREYIEEKNSEMVHYLNFQALLDALIHLANRPEVSGFMGQDRAQVEKAFTLIEPLRVLQYLVARSWTENGVGEGIGYAAMKDLTIRDPAVQFFKQVGTNEEEEKNPIVRVSTSMGDIKIELYEKQSPETVKNFLSYVNDKFYDGTIFHRVIPGFMIQGGGFTENMEQKPTKPPIKNESANGLKNDTYTFAMARTSVPDSATSQFFINVKNNDFLNRDKSQDGVGYAVFGKVIEGMDVVNKIERVPTTRRGTYSDVPVEPVVVNR